MENEKIALDITNIEQQKAYDLVANTNTSLFITGKAGTGKTTFVKRIQEEINKNFLVLAPTGIAAINAGGRTIHSFFGFPLEVITPRTKMEVSYEKRLLLQRTDTIIIDEASMVRCDLVDGMDRFLRAIFSNHLPFGGKQMVFVGDLFQLPPVVKHGSVDDEVMKSLYGEGVPYFYKASVMRRMNLPKIEFTHVYRQNDEVFLDILNRMRFGENTWGDLDILNKRVCKDMSGKDFYITVTSKNSTADEINNAKLAELEGEEFCYEGISEGEIKINDMPVPEKLFLKEGAQVIFCRNDYANGCVNGTIAKVKELSEESIIVRLENGNEVKVEKMTWESKEKTYDPIEHKLETEIVGTFTQYPLKLAWAITIHKSQGMTFDRMHFDLADGTFMPGQAYVAISRLRTLDGLTLSRSIHGGDIKQNEEIRAFANTFNDMAMIDDELDFDKDFYSHLTSKDYDNAAKACLGQMLKKMARGDFRNAALVAKKMFDVMLDDECLKGATIGIPLLKDCSMTCNFLNAVLCQYSNRYEEAIGYADLVLARKACLEAMFIKGKALFELGRYVEALDVVSQIREKSAKSEDKMPIDKKQYLFEAKLNQQLGRANMDICKRLCKLCHEYVPAYVWIRKEAIQNNLQLQIKDDDKDKELVAVFNNTYVSDADFAKMLSDAKGNGVIYSAFIKKVRKIGEKDEKIDPKQKVELSCAA
jgi:tetratricopeptide (TPR) repeat protein